MQLRGVIEDIVFRNEENGYTVFVLAAGDSYETAQGSFPTLAVGEHLELEGDFYEHSQYGRQFKVTSFHKTRPQTPAETEAYLASGLFKGIGPSTARQLVDYFGPNVLEVLDKHIDRLTEIPGIGKAKLAVIKEGYAAIRESGENLLFLQRLGLSVLYCNRILKLYGNLAREKVEENPYSLTDALERFSFRQADELAQKLGIAPYSNFRLQAGLKAILADASQEGNMYLPETMLTEKALLLLQCEESLIADALERAGLERSIIRTQVNGEQACYLAGYYYTEMQAARRLLTLLREAKAYALEDIRPAVTAFEKGAGLELAPRQREAVEAALCKGVLVITGGPGTGKTTTLQCILRLLQARGDRVLLCAPTGRAAKRMSEVTGAEAKTLHRLLEYSPGEEGSDTFARNGEHPLECDAVIADEASMIDIFLFRSLLEAMPAGARLILVGDADQLPSVGAGNVLRDCISCGLFPVTRLDEIFRQAAKSMIVVNAHRINHGEEPIVNRKESDFFFVDAATEAQTAERLLELVLNRLPAAYGIPAEQIMVLCPQKKGECGVYNLNRQLQRLENPPGRGVKELKTGEDILREGDKVMQLRNNYRQEWRKGPEKGAGIYNGDIGRITKVHPGGVTVLFEDGRETDYDPASLPDLTLAYAASVHKSQGCEFDLVVVPLSRFSPVLYTRNLLYTAVTRAKKFVVLAGSRAVLLRIIQNDSIRRRYSGLEERLKALSKVL